VGAAAWVGPLMLAAAPFVLFAALVLLDRMLD
jgi:hypothetical protein